MNSTRSTQENFSFVGHVVSAETLDIVAAVAPEEAGHLLIGGHRLVHTHGEFKGARGGGAFRIQCWNGK